MSRTKHAAADHRDDELREPAVQMIGLDNERGSSSGSLQIGVRKQHQDDVPAFTDGIERHHSRCTQSSRGCPSPRQNSRAVRGLDDTKRAEYTTVHVMRQ